MEINMQEWDKIQVKKTTEKVVIEQSLIDLYNKLKINIPSKSHQEILDELHGRLKKNDLCWPIQKPCK